MKETFFSSYKLKFIGFVYLLQKYEKMHYPQNKRRKFFQIAGKVVFPLYARKYSILCAHEYNNVQNLHKNDIEKSLFFRFIWVFV